MRVAILALAALVAATSGCATVAERRLRALAGAHVYQCSYEQLSEQVKGVLASRGELLLDEERHADRWILHTRFREALVAKRAGRWIRYAIVIRRIGPGHAQLQVAEISRSTIGMAGVHPYSRPKDGKHAAEWGGEGPDQMGSGERVRSNPDILRRDLDLEWELVKALDPRNASRLEAQATFEPPRSASMASR